MLAAALLALGALGSLAGSARAQQGAPPTLRLGSQTLGLCKASPLAYCGHLAVPLDYSSPASPRTSIAYRWYPAYAAGAPAGTVVPVEGGPGYPSIGSVEGGYSVMYGGLLAHWNTLVVDNRGTGRSTPLKCHALQDFSGETASGEFQAAASGCAARLDRRWRYRHGGGWVRASDLFTSAPAARDLAAVIDALGVGKVDLYGDSYGSFFAQVFASRYPELLRSVVLDSTYQTIGLDPWYRSTLKSMPAAFDEACSRAPACVQAESGTAWERISELAEGLRENPPLSARVPGPQGRLTTVTMGVVGLVDLVNDAAGDPQIYRELDAAARAQLDEGDPAPLLRLYAQRLAIDEAYFGLPASEYSVELYLAVSCLDYPQLFDMNASPSQRYSELQAAQASLSAQTFSPFSVGEWLAQDQNTEAYSACLQWPSPRAAEPPIARTPPLLPSSLPVLVLGGELDTWTPPSDVPKVLADIGGHARFIELANSTHVVGEGDTVCGSTLVQAFIADPQAIDSLDASCAAAVPAIHAVGVYPGQLSGEPPLTPAAPTDMQARTRELAAAAVSTAGDAIARYQATEAAHDHGLFGGHVTALRGGRVLILRHDRLLPEVSVSGTVTLSPDVLAANGEDVIASLSASAPGAGRALLSASWSTSGEDASALVTGSDGVEPISGNMPAP